MVKKYAFTRLFRGNKRSDPSEPSKPSETMILPPTSTTSNAVDQQDLNMLWSSPKYQQLFSLLKCSNPNGEQVPSVYSLRLYLATIQKLKRHQPTTMEKQRAVYHILSNLVVPQELDRFEPAFEPIGRKPRKTRYISALLDTPADDILPYHHPVSEASKRKPFVETVAMIIPLSPSSSSSSVATFCTFPPYRSNRSSLSPIQSSCSDPSIYLTHRLHHSTTVTNDDEDNIPLAILKNKKK